MYFVNNNQEIKFKIYPKKLKVYPDKESILSEFLDKVDYIIKGKFHLYHTMYNCLIIIYRKYNWGPFILRKHIFMIFGPHTPLCKHVFSMENKQNFSFSTPTPPYKCI